MAVLSPVAADVRTVSATSSQISNITFGETVTAGQSVRKSTSDSKYYLVDADTVAAEDAEFDGIALQGGVADEEGLIQTGGEMYLGVDTTPGMVYTNSATPGAIEEATSSLVSGNNVTVFGYGKDAGTVNTFVFSIIETGETIYP